ncbi:MAG: response regulator transcription factor [Bacteroidia bacterium]|nr:response regulator transcription factor [Bacteroidia bacterium]
MITAIIIDDETKARETIMQMISLYCKNVTVVSQADGVNSAFEAINLYKPDLVFLDIELSDGTGFDLLKRFNQIDFKIIFITVYDEYAIKVFKFSAVDYILKPIGPDDLVAAVDKAEKLYEKENINQTLSALISNLGQKQPELKKIILKTSENIHMVDLQDIVRCESEQNYTKFFFSDGKKILVSRTLKEYDELLCEFGFFRVHQTHLVNIKFIDHYVKGDGGYLIMKDKSQIPVSYRKKDQLLNLFNKLSF